MTIASIAMIFLIVAIAFVGMRLMQRATGCACEIPYDRDNAPKTNNAAR